MSHLIKTALSYNPYTIFGHKGKQVRDQIHSEDVISAFQEFLLSPKAGEVYNLGGGRTNSASILEILVLVSQSLGRELETNYSDVARKGDHICYYSDMSKFQSDYPNFKISKPINLIVKEMIEALS